MSKKINGDLIISEEEVGVALKPAIADDKLRHVLKRQSPEEWPFYSITATTDMKDFIGNITAVGDKTCSVKGVYRGRIVELRNVTLCFQGRLGERVMITEHVGINGKFGFLATKKRILLGDINFINVGWSDEKSSRKLTVDVYTGEVRETRGEVVPPSTARIR